MKLNLDYYKEDVYYNTGKDEEKIIKYIIENSPNKYEKIIENDMSAEVILALSSIRNNIIYAYDFEPNATILEIGAHFGEVTDLLCQRASKVVTIESVKSRAEAIEKRCKHNKNLEIFVGNIKDIELEDKFDYITLFGILEYAPNFFEASNPAKELINCCEKFLKENGKILIATNNKFALKSFVGDIDECTNNTFDSITGYKGSKQTYKLGKRRIENILMSTGFENYKFFYPLPDYKLPNMIFTDEYLPTSSKINGYFPYYRDDSSIFFSEVDCYDAIIKEDPKIFSFFANSYFIEASKNCIYNETRYVSFNNYRKKQYRLMTKIKKDVVEKTYTNDDSKQHMENMKKNIDELKNTDIEILDEYNDEKIVNKFIDDKLVSQKIGDNIEEKRYVLALLKRYKEEIYRLAEDYEERQNTIFDIYLPDTDKEIIKNFKYLKNGYWDMIFKNCFLIDDKFVYFDQEWKEENIPAEFLIYRCIINIEKLRNKIDEYEIYKELGISQYIELFQKLDNEISKKIFDEKIFKLYTREHSNPIYDIGKLKAELNDEINKSQELEKSIMNLSSEIFQKNDTIVEKDIQLKVRSDELTEKDSKIYEKDDQLKEKNNVLEEQSKKINELTEKLNAIYESRAWKIIKKFMK